MMLESFLVQIERNPYIKSETPLLAEDTAAFVERVSEHNWLRPDDRIKCVLISKDALCIYTKKQLQSFVPIGSIEFVEEVMSRAFGIPCLTPYHIPRQLQEECFLHRQITVVPQVSAVPSFFEKWDCQNLFLKSADTIKCDYTGAFAKTDRLPDATGSVFVSQCLDFSSEWRTFVWNGRIIDIRCYGGDPWLVPDKNAVERMVCAISNTIPAYTLDVGVTENRTVAVIEVHNFISCGLYGATVPIPMYRTGYHHELRRAGIITS